MEAKDGELRDVRGVDTSRDEKRRLERDDTDRDAKRLKSEGERAKGGSRDRSRERSRDEKRSREDRDKGRDRSRERDKSRRKGDKGRDKSPLSSSSSRDRDRAKDRDGDRPRSDRGRERSKEKDREKEKENSKGRKDRDGDRGDDEEDKEEKLRLKREAILAKYKAKSAGGAGGGLGSQSPNVTSAPIARSAPAAATAAAAPSAPVHAAGTNGDTVSDDKGSSAAPVKEERYTQEGTPPTANGNEGEDDKFSLTTPIRWCSAKEEDGFAEGERAAERNDMDRRMGVTNADNWDDAKGYFKTRPGEVIANRYKVMRDLGHGMYSTVVSGSDEQQGNMEVAIKLIRSNETMYKAGRKEIKILNKLVTEDQENKRHICRLLSHFEYKNHLCMVFVPAEMNLRELLKTYGREVGITLTSIKVYAKQLLIGLDHMIKCQVVHGDINQGLHQAAPDWVASHDQVPGSAR